MRLNTSDFVLRAITARALYWFNCSATDGCAGVSFAADSLEARKIADSVSMSRWIGWGQFVSVIGMVGGSGLEVQLTPEDWRSVDICSTSGVGGCFRLAKRGSKCVLLLRIQDSNKGSDGIGSR